MAKMREIAIFFQSLASIMACDRRSRQSDKTGNADAARAKAPQHMQEKTRSPDARKTHEHFDIGSDSTDDSDHAANSTDDSDTETSSFGCASSGPSIVGESIGVDIDTPPAWVPTPSWASTIGTPPGLHYSPIFPDSFACAYNAEETQLNAWAKPFVPTFPTFGVSGSTYNEQDWQAFPSLMSEAEEWGTYKTIADESQCGFQSDFGHMQRGVEQDSSSLTDQLSIEQHVLSKLEPENAALLKSLLNAKYTIPDPKEWCANEFQATRQLQQSAQVKTPSKANVLLKQPSITKDSPGETDLHSNVCKLSQIDPLRIFVARKINRLGLSSAEHLKAYFSKFGIVDEVLVSHSIDKSCMKQRGPRIRPAGLAFIVMHQAEDVVEILRHGSDHVVLGVSTCVSAYQRPQ
jgi:hypothetical protein